ncbi:MULTISPECIES: YgfZ/GcvT domain-containing protein [unclassified Aureimonas]|uniref:CAF17-like 4Fe-4S cluster assembly/insertion protein YgfZ n=1 Tax=unclassified Aureimonas TaxID=2615206 RepID=UPI0007001B58|nr:MULTISPECIES: folate-binding protein YgfZ [unclassified Aureimonas]KQT55321.1 aminomethyltransferase [Aureimonas sp. Leaf427]KQT71112.1 aminomethyltransferase [Aureimonas sp. Leaf460]
MPFARLADRRLLLVKGETASAFLQNLVTSDLDAIGGDEVRPSALLTPQGKILFDFLLSRIEDGIRIDVASIARADLLKRLTLYRLRAPIAFETPETEVFAIWDEEVGSVDRRFAETSVRRLYGEAPAGIEERPSAEFEALRIRAGIAEAERDFPASDVFPHDVLLDQNAGVSFKKGCYVGQEVVSRMQHRGTARRRLVLVEADGHLTPGAEIQAGERPIGTVLTATGGAGMAIVRIDRLAAALAADIALAADGVRVDVAIPPWAGYVLPEPAPAGEDAGS